MTATDETLRDVLTRLNALEQLNETQAREIDTLKQQNAALIPNVAQHPVSSDAIHAMSGSPLEQLSRRWVLRRGMQAAAATVVAGVLVQRQPQEAHAAHTGILVDADNVYAHYIQSRNENGSDGVYGVTTSTTEDFAGVWGTNNGVGAGIYGRSSAGVGVIGEGVNGVRGESHAAGYAASYGMHIGAGEGYGVVGDAAGTSGAGVLGRHTLGTGVHGEGKTGLRGVSPNGAGVFGEGGSGYGGVFKGVRAQVRLTPTGRIGKPTTGAHQVGELYLDKVGTLFICTVTGTPGTWKKVTVS